MEGAQKIFLDVSKDLKKAGISSSSAENPYSFSAKEGMASTISDQSRVLIARPPRQMISAWTCSKLCAVFFVAGVFVGFTLKRRVRKWASKLLRRLRDD